MNSTQQPLLFSVQLAMVASLYVVIIAAVNVVFSIVNIWWFDPAAGYWEYQAASSAIRYGVATLLVFAPIYFGLLYYRDRTRPVNSGSHYLSVTQWLIYLSLVVVGGAIAFQLVSLILAFLEGDVTVRLLMKAAGLFILVLVPALYHWYDLQAYWAEHKKTHRQILVGYMIVFALVIGVGIYTIDSPTEARERSLDQRQLQDLQEIAWRIDDYIRVNAALPDDLSVVFQRPGDVPAAPADRPGYIYRPVTPETLRYELCATFHHPSGTLDAQPWLRTERGGGAVDWGYDAGEWCFEVTGNLD